MELLTNPSKMKLDTKRYTRSNGGKLSVENETKRKYVKHLSTDISLCVIF